MLGRGETEFCFLHYALNCTIDKRGGNRIGKFRVMLPDVSNSYTFCGRGGIL